MSDNKKFTPDKDTLEGQLDKLKDVIEGDKKTMAENKAIARDPNHAFDEQGKWAEARNKGIEEGLNRNQQQYAETEERLKRLKRQSNESQDK
jgi:hypothetical protein